LDNWPADEETACEPQNIYGKTKMAAETEAQKYYEETKFPIVILRPSWVYGPGCPRTLKIYKTLQSGHFVMIGKGNNLRHPIYIQDMLSALILAMEAESAVGETFIIGGKQTYTTSELVGIFSKELDLPKPRIRLPMCLGQLIAVGSEKLFRLSKKEPPLSPLTEGIKETQLWLVRNA
jgi:nucleoside-diphosphate-sugar epimerase